MSSPIGWPAPGICKNPSAECRGHLYADLSIGPSSPRPRRVSLPFAAAVAEFVAHVCCHLGRGAWCLRGGGIRSSSRWGATVARSIDTQETNPDHMLKRQVV